MIVAGLRVTLVALLALNGGGFLAAAALGASEAAGYFALGAAFAFLMLALLEGLDRFVDRFPDDWTIHG
jgi:hypothetical protein